MSGATVDGTFCEYAVAFTDYVTPIPDSLDSAEAAAIMCAVCALVLSVGGDPKLIVATRIGYHRLQRASAEWYSHW